MYTNVTGWEAVLVIDFNEEIKKYKPVRTVHEVEDDMNSEISDMMDLLQYISGKASGKDGANYDMPKM